MGIFINKSFEEVRTDKENLRKLQAGVSHATSIITTAAYLLFIIQPAVTPRVKEKLRKGCLFPETIGDTLVLKILPWVVAGFFVISFLCGSSYAAVSFKGIR